MNKGKGRGWPLSIIGIFIFLSIMLFGILYISLRYVPVNKENVFQMGYQDVDKSYNEIVEEQKRFNKLYSVKIHTLKLSQEPVETLRVNGEKAYFEHAFTLDGDNRFDLEITDKASNKINNAVINLLLTRYETSEFDQELTITKTESDLYFTNPFTIDHAGRWKIVAKVTIGKNTGYFEQSVYAR